MSRPSKLNLHAAAAMLIMSLVACNNIGLLDQMENPGQASSSSNRISTLFLFGTAGIHQGDVRNGMASARDGADSLCAATRGTLTFPDNGCTQVRAVISLTTADSIANMPGNYGVPTNRSINGPNNFVIASDWNTLIAGTSGNSLSNGAVMPAATTWWSFSTTGGNFDGTNNCSGGTINTSINGAAGDSSTTGNTWLAGTSPICSTSAKLLCVCY